MNKQSLSVTLDRMIGGGQAIGTCQDGKKALLWNALPGETVTFQAAKKKSRYVEGVATEIVAPSSERIAPLDPDTYLSTSPWQIMSFEAEQHYKAALIEEAFELHDIVLPNPITIWTDGRITQYRNKVEFSFFGKTDEVSGREMLDLAFFRRGSKGKVIVRQCALLPDNMMELARQICAYLQQKQVQARQLKTLLIRSNQQGECLWQLYVKDPSFNALDAREISSFAALGGEVIFSDPKSPASRVTSRLIKSGETTLTDHILNVPFRYATEGFFQINLPVYEHALKDMWEYTKPIMDHIGTRQVIDFYSGVGSIGLTIGGEAPVLVEVNEDAVREMRRNIKALGSQATAILAPTEKALEHISSSAIVIVDPPRAGLHKDVIAQLLETLPPRIIYLSCNPVTQARDIALLASGYGVLAHKGYNFFPRTPHIEHLVILDRLS